MRGAPGSPSTDLVGHITRRGPWVPWVVLAFGLVYYLLFAADPATSDQLRDVEDKIDANRVAIEANRVAIEHVDRTMLDAAKTMHDAVARRNRHEEIVIELLLAQCLQGTDRGSAAEKDCWKAHAGNLTK